MILAASFDTHEPEGWLNRGLMYGDGVFETMRMQQQKIPLWSYHMQRMRNGLRVLDITPPDEDLLQQTIANKCPESLQQAAVIKLLVIRDQQERTYQPKSNRCAWVLTADPWSHQENDAGIKLGWAKGTLAHHEASAGIKHLSRLEQVLISAELNGGGSCDDLLVCDQQGHVVETTHQNLLIIRENQLLTPDLSHCGADGVALRWLKSHHDVVTAKLSPPDIMGADGLMVCNALRGFRWVNRLKGEHSFGTSHPIHDKIKRQWQALFNS